jgi:anthranilate/para-aminobenzoate synthase component I
MTGAPKIRAIEILEDLEAGPRGVYSGALGYLGFDGSADLGMTIRTLVFEGSVASLGVGGGITIDSNPEQELQETMLKAEALLKTMGGTTWNH